VWWQQLNKPGDFDDFYLRKMESLIDGVKNNLQPQ